MIDTWFVATTLLFILGFCAALRILPGPTRLDRLVALNAAITLVCVGLLPLSISMGNRIVLDIGIISAIVFFGITIYFAHREEGDAS